MTVIIMRGGSVLTPPIAGHNLKIKLGLIKFGTFDRNTFKIYTCRPVINTSGVTRDFTSESLSGLFF